MGSYKNPAMSRVDLYLDAAERANTRRSYASAIRHFEIEWRALLPATIDSIARYLAGHAESLSLNTLKHRLAALSRWHQEHGFTPTRPRPPKSGRFSKASGRYIRPKRNAPSRWNWRFCGKPPTG